MPSTRSQASDYKYVSRRRHSRCYFICNNQRYMHKATLMISDRRSCSFKANRMAWLTPVASVLNTRSSTTCQTDKFSHSLSHHRVKEDGDLPFWENQVVFITEDPAVCFQCLSKRLPNSDAGSYWTLRFEGLTKSSAATLSHVQVVEDGMANTLRPGRILTFVFCSKLRHIRCDETFPQWFEPLDIIISRISVFS